MVCLILCEAQNAEYGVDKRNWCSWRRVSVRIWSWLLHRQGFHLQYLSVFMPVFVLYVFHS